MIGPLEYRAEEVEKERQALAGIGLWDEKTGRPMVPDQALAGIITPRQPAGSAGQGELPQGLVEPMPSDSSGGVNWENRLR